MSSSFEFFSPTKLWDIAKIYGLYQKAFPKSERKPFLTILKNQKRGIGDIWCCRDGGSFVGFATTLNGSGSLVLDYLAIDSARRSSGYGTRILKHLRGIYPGKAIIIEIEDPDFPCDDREKRQRRREFYMRNGFFQTGMRISFFGVRMEILSTDSSTGEKELFELYRLCYGDATTDKFLKLLSGTQADK